MPPGLLAGACMLGAIMFPNIDPVAFRLGPLTVQWYGIAYVAGFVCAGFVARRLVRRWELGVSDDDLLEIVIGAVLGVVLGGRLGYVLVYGGAHYLRNPADILAIWQGGMSFHGGLVGILVAGFVLSRRLDVSFAALCDIGAAGAPIGIFFGRLANFVNGELWGRTTDAPWAVVFPVAGFQGRHPSQLYEAVLEGLVVFVVVWIGSRRHRPGSGAAVGWFLAAYGVVRLIAEQFREPDVDIGFVWGNVTMGQLLSLPLVIAGVWLVRRAMSHAREELTQSQT